MSNRAPHTIFISIFTMLTSSPSNTLTTEQLLHQNYHIRYALYFDEGPGYYLVNSLSNGTYSVTMLVMDSTDQEVYVRKLHDTQVFKDDVAVQNDDVRNWVSQSHVPKLTATHEYRTDVPVISDVADQQQVVLHRFVTPVSIWQLCNGGTVYQMTDLWHYGAEDRLPEAVIWNFLSSLLKTAIEVTEQGLSHTDIHEGNFLLHWPGDKVLPELFLADFGLSKRYPVPTDSNFAKPWTGAFDRSGTPISDKMTDKEKTKIRTWYAQAIQDMKDFIFQLHGFVFAYQLGNFLNNDSYLAERSVGLFAEAAQHGRSVNGYSHDLVKMIAVWSNILTLLWREPPQLMTTLKQLLPQVQRYGSPVIANFMNDSEKAKDEMQWFANTVTSNSGPLLWDTLAQFFHPISGVVYEPRINIQDRRRGSTRYGVNVFANYIDSGWARDSPLLKIEHDDLHDDLILRSGEFSVAEIAVPKDGSDEWYHLRTLRSMADAPLIEQRSYPPFSDQPNPAFINRWVNALLPGIEDLGPEHLREPLELPEDEDEDTSVGRRYRAWLNRRPGY